MVKFSKKAAIEYLGISIKEFDNYFKNSKEIPSFKKPNGHYEFDKHELDSWNELRRNRTVTLNIDEYHTCFEFAVKMSYSTNSSAGVGIRGVRSEVQMTDDFILGIIAEFAVKKFLEEKFSIKIILDLSVHPGNITPQDFHGIIENEKTRQCHIGVSIKSSKMKSCYNIIHPLEYEDDSRNSDVYIFVRVGLPSDHLFRRLRDSSIFNNLLKYLSSSDGYREIEELKEIPVWICGFSYYNQLKKVTSIPGQEFDGHRYIASTSEMSNSDDDWLKLIGLL